MKKQLLVATIAMMSLNAQSHAQGLKSMSDSELSDSVGQRQFNAAAFVNGLAANLNAAMSNHDDTVVAEDIIKQITAFASAFGMVMDNVQIDGMKFDGTGSISVANQNGLMTTRPFPTYIETMTFDLSAGGGPRIGQVEIQGLHMQGLNIQVSIH